MQAVGNTDARDARRIFNYSIRDISISFTAAYAFFLPPPLPVERPSLLKFLLVPLINTFLTYSTLTVCHFQHFKCFWAFKSSFYTKIDAYSSIHFFRQQKIANTRKTLLTFMPLTNKKNAILLKLWTYIREKCANIGKKNRESNVHSPRNLKIHLIFWTDLVWLFLGMLITNLSDFENFK